MKHKYLYLLFLLILGCSPPKHDPYQEHYAEDPKKLPYTDSELADIEYHYKILREILMLLKDSGDLPVQSVGHAIWDDEIFYRNCIGSRKEQTIDVSKCNYNGLLDSLHATTLLNSIKELKKFKIIGSGFSSPLQDFYLYEDVEYSSYGDNRFLYFNENDVPINKHVYHVLERRGNLYYLG